MKTRTEQAALLRSRIEASGLSARRFAVEVLLREDRTIRRWLDGKSPIPKVVLAWLERPKVAPWPFAIAVQSEEWSALDADPRV